MDYPEVGEMKVDGNCDALIKRSYEHLYQGLSQALTQFINESVQCITDNARTLNWADSVMREVIFVTTRRCEDVEELEEIKEDFEKTLISSMESCPFKKHFGAIFDNELCQTSKVLDEEATTNKLCLIKYVRERNLLHENDSNMAELPFDVRDNSNRICEKTYETLRSKLESKVTSGPWLDDRKVCVSGKKLGSEMTDKAAVAVVQCQKNSTEKEKEILREKFISFMSKLANSKFICHFTL